MSISLSQSTFLYTLPGTVSATCTDVYTYNPVWTASAGAFVSANPNSLSPTLQVKNRTSPVKVSVYQCSPIASVVQGGAGLPITVSGYSINKISGGSGAPTRYPLRINSTDIPVVFRTTSATQKYSVISGLFSSSINPSTASRMLGFSTSSTATVLNYFWHVAGSATVASVIINNEVVATFPIYTGANPSLETRLTVVIEGGRRIVFYANTKEIYEHFAYPELAVGYTIVGFEGTSSALGQISGVLSHNSDYAGESRRYTAIQQVNARMLVQPTYPYSMSFEDTSQISTGEDAKKVTLVKDTVPSLSLAFPNLIRSEMESLRDMYEWHKGGIPFYFDDIVMGKRRKVRFGSFNLTVSRSFRFQLEATLIETGDAQIDIPVTA